MMKTGFANKNVVSQTAAEQLPRAVETLPLDTSLLAAGERVCVAVSGGADSTALLRALLARREELGLVVSVLHVKHGLRGADADGDAEFVTALAAEFGLACEVVAVDTRSRAAERKESIEEAARNLRYEVFREHLAGGKADKMATAHTLDDQAETVLMKLLRGAWTEGLSGIHPVLRLGDGGVCVRPLLGVSRAEIEAYLQALGQPWRVDETNASPDYTRNRVRHDLLPRLREYNPRIAETLGRMAANARAEEEHWRAELARWLPQLLLPGKPTRGGGRRVSTLGPGVLREADKPTSQERDPFDSPAARSGQVVGHPGDCRAGSVALDMARLRGLDAGLRRRVLRAAAEQCGATLDFAATERLLEMMAGSKAAGSGLARSAARLELPGGVRVERSARELRFERRTALAETSSAIMAYELLVPGTVEAPAFGARYAATMESAGGVEGGRGQFPAARVRAWRPGDRVEIAHSRGPKKVKEVLERMGIRGEDRGGWPVVEWQGRIVWMRGVTVRSEAATPRIEETRL